MSSAMLAALAFALVCVAAALVLLSRGARREGRVHAQRFIDSRIEPAARGAAAAAQPVPEPTLRKPKTVNVELPADGLEYWRRRALDEWINFSNRAGFAEIRSACVFAAFVAAIATAWAGSKGGALAALAALVGCATLVVLWLAMRIQRRRLRIVRQLPSFLDGIVRLVTIGNSVPAAFQSALATTEAPLRGCLDHVSRMLRAGVEIDRAMVHVARLYRVKEFELVGSVLRLSVKYGGRADVMLDRMSTFMRDLEQAERELSAMSAETRMSAWVLGLLPISAGSFIIASNPHYFASMWLDPSGRELVYLAFVLQLAGGVWLYRLARLR